MKIAAGAASGQPAADSSRVDDRGTFRQAIAASERARATRQADASAAPVQAAAPEQAPVGQPATQSVPGCATHDIFLGHGF